MAPRRREPLQLSPDVRFTLEEVLRTGTPSLARRVRVILARADGASVNAIATVTGIHRDTVRRWVARFRERGLVGLRHGNTGKPKNVIFDAPIRAEITRRADTSPRAYGEPFEVWSLYKLRDHLMARNVVRSISVERLRQLLGDLPYGSRHWHPASSKPLPLTATSRAELTQLAAEAPTSEPAQRARALLAVAGGASISEVASRLHVERGNLRRWIDQFRVAGVMGIADVGSTRSAPADHAILRVARTSPRAAGVASDRWTLEQLHAAVVRLGVAPDLTIEELRRTLSAAGLTL